MDDLQIYPVLVTKNPDRKFLNFVIKQGSTHITERIYKKTSTTEVQWIYSHDFHLFGITHADDTLAMMVDRIMGKLDEIAISIKSGVHIISPIDGQRMLREAFDVVMEKPRDTTARPRQIPGRANVVAGELWELPKRQEITAGTAVRETPKHPAVPKGELWEIYKRPEVTAGGASREKRPEIQPVVQPKEIPKRPQLQHKGKPPEIISRPKVTPDIEPREISRRPEGQIGIEPKERDRRQLQKEILRDFDVFGITPDSFGKSKKNIENIQIPKKSDINKKLADVEEEVKDLDWLYE